MINNGRGSFDFARTLLAHDNDDQQPGPVNYAVPRWCNCGNCIQMPTPEENKCCQRRECITSYELFNNLCTDGHDLELAIRARCDIRMEPPGLFNGQFQKCCIQAVCFMGTWVFRQGQQKSHSILHCEKGVTEVSCPRQCVHGLFWGGNHGSCMHLANNF